MSTTLEELRRLTLEQQRAEAAAAEPQIGGSPSPSQTLEPVSVPRGETPSLADRVRPPSQGDAHLRISADPQMRKQVLAQASKQTNESTRFLDRVREGIARKIAHPGGVKASVDISPELSLRVKRYCLDHGNVPVRLVFVELLTAFLEEEGY